ncbi:MAG: hypothetical protein IPN88_15090 [Bacteroidetes bacterium]|nr:hypothetical protein [Bacteroidota bacterium]
MEQLTFDQAIELLEITNISKLKKEDLISLEKKSKKRWHPDKVAHLNDPLISKEYTQKFQQIEFTCKLVLNSLQDHIMPVSSFRVAVNMKLTNLKTSTGIVPSYINN